MDCPYGQGCFSLLLTSPPMCRGGPLTQGLATVTRSRGGFDESTPTQGSATAPTCGEGASAYAFRLRQACAETGRPPMAKRLPPTKLCTHLNNRLPLLLPIRTIPKKEFCPIFGVNLRILPISGACRPASATPPLHRDLRSLRRDKPAATVASPICDVEVKIRGCVILISDC